MFIIKFWPSRIQNVNLSHIQQRVIVLCGTMTTHHLGCSGYEIGSLLPMHNIWNIFSIALEQLALSGVKLNTNINRKVLFEKEPYFTVSMAAKISFIRPTLLSVRSSPSFVSFRILESTSVCPPHKLRNSNYLVLDNHLTNETELVLPKTLNQRKKFPFCIKHLETQFKRYKQC